MSTILQSLKKLEEEKSVLEKSFDLTSLLIQKEPVATEWHFPAPPQIFAMTALVGLVLGGLWVAGVFESPAAPVRQAAVMAPAEIAMPPQNKVPPAPVYAGVALASIPSAAKPVIDSKSLGSKPTVKKPKPMKAALPAQEASPSTVKKSNQPQSAPPLQKTRPLQAAPNLEEALLPKEPPMKKVDRVAPESPAMVTGTLPGFTLRGIIYFDTDSPYNYIFVATAEKKNLKLKAGEKILGATLKKIEPDSAVFAHQGRLIQILIGHP